jgi:ATP-binding cassette subfamily B protein
VSFVAQVRTRAEATPRRRLPRTHRGRPRRRRPRVHHRSPQGYHTRVGQRGRLLSGGQRQRIAIARAIIRDARILLLDEPTTSLDAEAGRRILAPLRRLMSGRTTILISHDLRTVTDAQQILYLDHGRITETGTHSQLLAHNDRYTRLYHLHQAADART